MTILSESIEFALYLTNIKQNTFIQHTNTYIHILKANKNLCYNCRYRWCVRTLLLLTYQIKVLCELKRFGQDSYNKCVKTEEIVNYCIFILNLNTIYQLNGNNSLVLVLRTQRVTIQRIEN